MTATTCDVCIIGGGPGGLATALALIRALPGIQVKARHALCIATATGDIDKVLSATSRMQVFERAKAFRPLGAGVGIEVNGLKAIEAIDPTLEAWFVRNGYFQRASVTYDHQGPSQPHGASQVACMHWRCTCMT
jgi:2-polyprenyl-6-methoxyphenol hydroxylase-like FAD-dependent oxidoreductase